MNPSEHSSEFSRIPRFPGTLDDLRSTTKCPMCFTPIGGAHTCVECGLNLRNPELAAVFAQSSAAAGALVERGNLLAKVWRSSQQPAVDPAVATPPALPTEQPRLLEHAVPARTSSPTAWNPTLPPAHGGSPDLAHPPVSAAAPTPVPSGSGVPPVPSTPQESLTPRRSGIQMVLLVIGVSFVSIAAIVFLTVAFVLFDLTVKTIITAGVTAGVIALATWLKRTRLNATAEGVAILGVVLLLLDMWAIRALNLLGLERIDGTLFWGVGLLVVTAILLGWGRLSTLRAPQLASTFTFGPGVFALVRWIFDWAFTPESATLIGLAGLAIASLLSPILHRQHHKPDPLEVGVVFGLGQLAAIYLVGQSLIHLLQGSFGLSSQAELMSAPHPLELPLVTLAVCLIATIALIGQQRELRKYDSLAGIRWLRISAVVIHTLLWATVVLVSVSQLFSATPDRVGQADLILALPLIGLAAVLWDTLQLRSGTRDRARWLSGLITTAVTALVPLLVLIAVVGSLPLFRAMSTDFFAYSIDWPLFAAGLALAVCAGVAIGAYLRFARAAEGVQRRITIAAILVTIGLSLAAVALPAVAAIIALGVMMIGAIAVTAWLGRERLPQIRFIVLATYIVAALGLLLMSFLHRPLALATFAAVGIGFLSLRVLRGHKTAMPLTLVTALLTVITTLVSWNPGTYPVMSVVFAIILPASLLLIASGWRQLDVTDRRVFGWVGTLLLFVVATQQFPLSLVPFDELPANLVWALCVAAAIALVTICVLFFTACRAARADNADAIPADAFTHTLTLTATVPLGYIAVSPFVQIVAELSPSPVAEIMFVWVVVIGAVVTAAFLTLARLNGLPGRWTLVADFLATLAAFSALTILLVLTIPSNYQLPATSVIALALAITVPLALSIRSVTGQPRGRLRGVLPWIAAGFFALFGPILIARLIAEPWPLFVAAPIAIALLVTTLVFQVSGSAERVGYGSWVTGGMLTFGIALPLATGLGSRGFVAADQTWLLSLIVAVLAVGGLVISTARFGRAQFVPSRLLLATVLASLSSMALITAVSDVLEYVAETDSLAPQMTSFSLAGVTGAAAAFSLLFLKRAVTAATTSLDAGQQRVTGLLHFVSIGGIAFVAFSALMLPPHLIDMALMSAAIALAFASHFVVSRARTLPRAYVVLSVIGLALACSLIETLFGVFAGQHLEFPLVAAGIAAILLVTAVLLATQLWRMRGDTAPRPLPLRILNTTLIPVGIWAALMAAPIAWPWWIHVAAGTLSVVFAVTCAIFRSRLDTAVFVATGIAAIFPLITALFVADESVRAWPVAWLAVSISLLAIGFAITHAIGAGARIVGTILALVSSAMLLWPVQPDATTLLVALPGCALLTVMAVVTQSLRYRVEPGAYAATVPVWFALITAAAADAISGDTAVLIMVIMLGLAVAAMAVGTTRIPRLEPHRGVFQLIAGGSGLAAVIAMVLSFRTAVSVPADVYFLAFGLSLTAVGGLWMRARPTLRSFLAMGPGLAVLFIPLWEIEASEPTALRIGIFTVLVLAAILIGALGKLKAPLVIGSIAAVAHLIVAVRWMLPELSLPWWVWLGSAGALLIFVAATYEARLRNAKTLVRSISQLR